MLIKITCMATKEDKVSLTQTVPAVINTDHIIFVEPFTVEREDKNIDGVSIHLDSGNIFYANVDDWNKSMGNEGLEKVLF